MSEGQNTKNTNGTFGGMFLLIFINLLSLRFQWLILVECGMWLVCLVVAILENQQENEDDE